jgi:glycosyltransferase involved in cell wall biosynthesis
MPHRVVHSSDEELARLCPSCDAYMLPSVIEGLGTPPLGAMACDDVVITTNCPGTRDPAANEVNSSAMPPGDSAAFSHAIVWVLPDSPLRPSNNWMPSLFLMSATDAGCSDAYYESTESLLGSLPWTPSDCTLIS